VPDPVTVTCAPAAPERMLAPPLAVHAYDWTVRLQDAPLPLASNTIELLAANVAGKETAAMGGREAGRA
jgi:hypothetical protein